jgi:hypothetical protein
MSGTDDRHGAAPRGSFLDTLRERTVASDIDRGLPRGLRVATAYAWRFVVIAIAAGILIWLVIQLKLLVIPLMVAILVTALLWPPSPDAGAGCRDGSRSSWPCSARLR